MTPLNWILAPLALLGAWTALTECADAWYRRQARKRRDALKGGGSR